MQWRGNSTPQMLLPDLNWKTVTGGAPSSNSHSCAITDNNDLYCWGKNRYGEVGTGESNSYYSNPVMIAANVNKVDVNRTQTCAIINNGYLYCWGESYGNEPQQIGTSNNWNEISILNTHKCGIKNNGNLYCWGGNSHGELGVGDTINKSEPTKVGDFTDWNKISVGRNDFSCGIRDNGKLYCWGRNNYGQLGLEDIGPDALVTTPQQVGTFTDWDEVYIDGSTTYAIRDGKLYSWGQIKMGKFNLYEIKTEPQRIGTATNWNKTSSYCGIRDHKLNCWSNASGIPLGLQTYYPNTPQKVE